MLTSYSQPSSLSEHLCGRRQLGDVVNVGDFSAPYHLSEDHMRQSFLSLLFFQHLTLLFLCHFSPWFKSYSHCSHSQWNPTGFFFLPMVLSSVRLHLQPFYWRVISHFNVFSNGMFAEDAISLWHIEGRPFCFSNLRFCECTSDYPHVYPGNYFSTFLIKSFFGCLR